MPKAKYQPGDLIMLEPLAPMVVCAFRIYSFREYEFDVSGERKNGYYVSRICTNQQYYYLESDMLPYDADSIQCEFCKNSWNLIESAIGTQYETR